MSASMQPEFNRNIHKQLGPKYNPADTGEPLDPVMVTPSTDGARMEGNYYSSRPAAIFENENRRQEEAVRPLPAADFDPDIKSAYALKKSGVDPKEADAP